MRWIGHEGSDRVRHGISGCARRYSRARLALFTPGRDPDGWRLSFKHADAREKQILGRLFRCGVLPAATGSLAQAESGVQPTAATLRRISEYARCMRQHGTDVRLRSTTEAGPLLDTSQVDFKAPRTRAATKACGSYLAVKQPPGL